MQSITKVSEKAKANWKIGKEIEALGIMTIIMSIVVLFSATIAYSELQTMFSDVNQQVINHIMQESMIMNVGLFGTVGGGLLYFMGYMYKRRTDKMLGVVMGVADLEIAILEDRIQEQIEKNSKKRELAKNQIAAIDDIEKKQLELQSTGGGHA